MLSKHLKHSPLYFKRIPQIIRVIFGYLIRSTNLHLQHYIKNNCGRKTFLSVFSFKLCFTQRRSRLVSLAGTFSRQTCMMLKRDLWWHKIEKDAFCRHTLNFARNLPATCQTDDSSWLTDHETANGIYHSTLILAGILTYLTQMYFVDITATKPHF